MHRRLIEPTIFQLCFSKPIVMTAKEQMSLHCRINSMVQHSSASVLFITDRHGCVYSHFGRPIDRVHTSKAEHSLMRSLRKSNSIAVNCLRPMSVDDIKDLFTVLHLDPIVSRQELPKWIKQIHVRIPFYIAAPKHKICVWRYK